MAINALVLQGMTEDDHQIAMVLEKVEGPEMAEHLKKVRYYSEQQAAYMFYQVSCHPSNRLSAPQCEALCSVFESSGTT